MSCSKQSFSIGKEEDFNEFNKDDMIELKGLYMNKNTGKVYFVVDNAYMEIISFFDQIGLPKKIGGTANELEKWN